MPLYNREKGIKTKKNTNFYFRTTNVSPSLIKARWGAHLPQSPYLNLKYTHVFLNVKLFNLI